MTCPTMPRMGEGGVNSSAARLVADFLDPARRALATHALAALGDDAVPVVASVLDGTARNAFGVSYRTFDEALRCALVTARFLARLAAPLEPALSSELEHPNPGIRAEAAAALGMLPRLSETSIAALAGTLEDDPDPASEAASVLLQSGLSEHTRVLDVTGRSARAAHVLTRTRA
jgi:hypothetical protein